MSRSQTLSLLATAILVGGCGMVSACSDSQSATTESAEARQSFPEGAARALSIGGRVASEGDDEFDIAVNCAAALRITVNTIGRMTGTSDSPEARTIKRAADAFASQAEAIDPESDVDAAVARRQSEKASSSGEQAQLAIACARKLEET